MYTVTLQIVKSSGLKRNSCLLAGQPADSPPDSIGAITAAMYPERAGLESPAMADDEGVLGNLPRSRPGKRSAKRDSAGTPSKAASRAAVKAEAGRKAAAKPARAASPKAGTKAAAAGSKAGAKPRRAATAKPGRSAAGAGAPAQRGATGARAGASAKPRVAAAAGADPVSPPRVDHGSHQSGDAVASAVRTAATVAVT